MKCAYSRLYVSFAAFFSLAGLPPTVGRRISSFETPTEGRRRRMQRSAVPQGVCFAALASADSNGDNFMDQDEYVAFLDYLTDGAFGELLFFELPLVLRSTYTALVMTSGSSELYIFGSRLDQTPDAAQLTFLSSICSLTGQALGAANVNVEVSSETPSTLSPTTSPPQNTPTEAPTGVSSQAPTPPSLPVTQEPTPSPSPEEEEKPPLFVQVFPAILVSNTDGLDSIALSFGSIRSSLNVAYAALVEEVVNELAPTDQSAGLAVTLVEHNTRLGYLQSRNCPISIYAYHVSICQLGTGTFILSVSGENGVDQEQASELQARYERAVDDAVVSGRLQQLLEQYDSRTPLRVDAYSMHAAEATVVPMVQGEEGQSSGSRSLLDTTFFWNISYLSPSCILAGIMTISLLLI